MSLKEAEHHIKNFLSTLEQKDLESLFQTVCGSKIPFTTPSGIYLVKYMPSIMCYGHRNIYKTLNPAFDSVKYSC